MKAESMQVGVYELVCAPMLAFDALDILPAVMAIAGPLLREKGGGAEALGSIGTMLGAPEHKGTLRLLVQACIKNTTVKHDGRTSAMTEEDFNVLFMANCGDMLRFVALHFRINFASFFLTQASA